MFPLVFSCPSSQDENERVQILEYNGPKIEQLTFCTNNAFMDLNFNFTWVEVGLGLDSLLRGLENNEDPI